MMHDLASTAMALLIAGAPTLADSSVLRECRSFRLTYDAHTGRLNCAGPDGTPVIAGLGTLIELRQGAWSGTFSTPVPKDSPLRREPFNDHLGKGEVVHLPAWSDAGGKVAIQTSVKLYDGEPFLVVVSKATVTGKEPIQIVRFAPLDASGGLTLDTDPRNVWFIENGNTMVFDFYVRRLRATIPVASNGNALFYAPKTDRGLVVGFLSHRIGATGIVTEVEAGDTSRVKTLRAQSLYNPPKPLGPGQTLECEAGVYVELTKGQPLGAAERWARSVAKVCGNKPGSHGSLVKWNPWSARYSHGMTEQNMTEEMDAAAAKLLPYGMNYFHLDSGWQKGWGDWEANERFPHGMKSIVDRMHKLGFKASTWIAPFAVDKTSTIAQQHPDWLLVKSGLGQRIVDENREALDLSKPRVRDWLRQLFKKLADEWGYDCFKIDFIYYPLACGNFSDTTKTYFESYREALAAIREGVGTGRSLLFIGVPLVLHSGHADFMRIGLDNKATWDKAIGVQGQGLRTCVRTLSRRYYLNGNLWVNHPDVLFTGDPDTAARWGAAPIQLDEARAWNALVGLTGGVICIGDSIAKLDGARLDMIRRIIPPVQRSARPLDLFERNFPELWNLTIERDFESWNVVGVFHWGENDQWGQAIPDRRRGHRVNFADLGLLSDTDYVVHEFWTDTHVGVKRGGFDVELEPHSCRVFAVRRARDVPQIVGMNRHITQGDVEVESVRWDAPSKTLTCTQKAVGGWPYVVTLRVPNGFTPVERVKLDGVREGLRAQLKPVAGSEGFWVLSFAATKTQDRLTWSVAFRHEIARAR